MENLVLSRTHHGMAALQGLQTASWAGLIGLQDLSLRFSDSGAKTLFIRFWQQLSRSMTDLENKIWELGGETQAIRLMSIPLPEDPETESSGPRSLDKVLLTRCINQQTHLLHLYAEARKMMLPFELRMVLQRHQLEVKGRLDELTAMHSAYSLVAGFNRIYR